MSDKKITIYHNPRCSKSRETLSILEENHKAAEVVEYLQKPPSSQTLKDIVAKLNIAPAELVRTGDQIYKDAGINIGSMSDDEVIEAICNHPAILQRPIVVCGDKAVIGRPPVKVLDII
jgi:arsenate reductase